MENDQVYDVKDLQKATIANIFKNKSKHLLKSLGL